MNDHEPVIVGALRTPVGKRGGRLQKWHPVDLLGETLRQLVERSGVKAIRRQQGFLGLHEQGLGFGGHRFSISINSYSTRWVNAGRLVRTSAMRA